MFPSSLKIAIVGTGAIGGYYGTRLAKAGHEVHFLCRSDFATIQAQGLTLLLSEGPPLRLAPALAHQSPASIGPVDLVLIALKTTANEGLPALLAPLGHAQTLYLTLQNGMGNAEALARCVPPDQVLGALCFICLNRTAPGVIENFYPGYLSLAEYEGPPRARTRALAALFEEAGVRCVVSDSLQEALWRKLCWNIPFNGLAIAAGGLTTDRLLACPELRRYCHLLMREVQQAAAACGIAIPDDFLDRQFRVTEPMGPYKPSSLIDWQAGRAIEVESIWGEPLRRGQARDVPMPYLESLYLLLKGLTAPNRDNAAKPM